MFGTGDSGRGFNVTTHSDLSAPFKQSEGQSLFLSLLIIMFSLVLMVLAFFGRNLAKGLKTLFRMLRPAS